MHEVTCVLDARAELGECPVWDKESGTLYWIDCARPSLNRFDPAAGVNRSWTLPSTIGSAAPRTRGGAVLALADGFSLLDFDSGAVTPIANPEADQPGNMFNDGKTDRRGRFWAGTLRPPETDPVGSLYRFDADHSWSRHDSGFICANGIGWSPDDRVMYFTDSRRRCIYAYEYDLATGEAANRRVFATLDGEAGFPDGLAVDAEGGVWTALWDGWRVLRLSPEGRMERAIAVPCAKPTSCAFGGADLRTLYITSAAYEATPEQLSEFPQSGGLFACDVGIAGLPQARFAG